MSEVEKFSNKFYFQRELIISFFPKLVLSFTFEIDMDPSTLYCWNIKPLQLNW